MRYESSSLPMMFALGLILVFGLGIISLLGIAEMNMASMATSSATLAQSNALIWLGKDRVMVDTGLPINGHAEKHVGQALDAWKIYALLLQGKCAAETVYCRSGSEKMYLCLDPTTKLVGAIFQIDGEIMSGFGSRADHWRKVVDEGGWERCK